MIDFGNTLKSAREAKGLTIAQIAEKTHMMSSIVEDLENERFGKIVAPIYGRGFVKLYCEAVGIDPKPMVAEFMDIFSGNRRTIIRERPTAYTPPPPPPEPIYNPPSEPKMTIPEATTPMEAAPEPKSDASEINPLPTPDAPVETYQEDFFESPKPLPKRPTPTLRKQDPKESHFKNYSAPLKDSSYDMLFQMKTMVMRWLIIGVVAIIVIWGLIAGIRGLYRATSRGSDTAVEASDLTIFNDSEASTPEIDNPSSVTSTTTSEPTATTNTRSALVIPPLYID